MNSIDKLRDCAEHASEGFFANLEQAFGLRRYRCGDSTVKPDGGAILNAIADEIEREVERDYMKLPVDKNGNTVHVGDVMIGWRGKITVEAISGSYVYYWGAPGKMCWNFAENLEIYHHNPPTVENENAELRDKIREVLRDE